jgi:hypothetical protein
VRKKGRKKDESEERESIYFRAGAALERALEKRAEPIEQTKAKKRDRKIETVKATETPHFTPT